jgi:hypothetical protein
MNEAVPGIVVIERRIDPAELRRLVDLYFGDMVKFVVDVRRRLAAVGGELPADAEQVLLTEGSSQTDPWEANDQPGRGPDECIEYTALINIRPFRGNPSMEIDDAETRRIVREIAHALIGCGEGLSQ